AGHGGARLAGAGGAVLVRDGVCRAADPHGRPALRSGRRGGGLGPRPESLSRWAARGQADYSSPGKAISARTGRWSLAATRSRRAGAAGIPAARTVRRRSTKIVSIRLRGRQDGKVGSPPSGPWAPASTRWVASICQAGP